MTEQKPTSVRWLVLALLSAFSLVSYLERVNISIAAELMMPDLGIDKIQLGKIFSSFLLGYAIFQVPAGWLGDRFGPRLTLTAAALIWGVSTVLTGLVPGALFTGVNSVLFFLPLIRFVLGAGEAATYPVAARAVRSWMPPSQHALGNSLMLGGMPVASAIAAPLVSWLMLRFGWRHSFYVTSAAAFLIATVWLWFSRDRPQKHPAVNAAELSIIEEIPSSPFAEPASPSSWKILSDRRVLLLSLSYICEGYVLFIFVFWLYIYLVDVRHFGILRGGMIASLPWITGIFFMPLGGFLCDRFSIRHGRLAGARIVIMAGYGLCGALLFVASLSSNRILAVAVLCLSVGCLLGAEASFWTSAVHLAGKRVGAVSGVMNTTGILGGIASTQLVPILVKYYGWLVALGSGAAVAVACVLIWWRLGHAGFGNHVHAMKLKLGPGAGIATNHDKSGAQS